MNSLKIILLCAALLSIPAAISAQGITSFTAGSLNNSSMVLTYSAGEVVSGNFNSPNFNFLGGSLGVTELISTSGEHLNPDLPVAFRINQNYPNPFNPSTTIVYELPTSSTVRIDIYNSIGAKVATLTEGQKTAGVHNIQFNASSYASGLYIYRFIADGVLISTKKMTLIK